MEETLLLNNDHPQTFDFKLDVEGIDPKDALVRFAIDDNGVFHSFACEKGENSVYSVYVPALPFLEKKTYPCKIEVVIDGYFFTPMTGSVVVAERPKVTITPVPEPEQPQEVTEPKKTPEERQKALSNLLQSIKPIEDVSVEDINQEPTITQDHIKSDKDEKVKKVLDDLKPKLLTGHINEIVEKERRLREILDSVQLK